MRENLNEDIKKYQSIFFFLTTWKKLNLQNTTLHCTLVLAIKNWVKWLYKSVARNVLILQYFFILLFFGKHFFRVIDMFRFLKMIPQKTSNCLEMVYFMRSFFFNFDYILCNNPKNKKSKFPKLFRITWNFYINL